MSQTLDRPAAVTPHELPRDGSCVRSGELGEAFEWWRSRNEEAGAYQARRAALDREQREAADRCYYANPLAGPVDWLALAAAKIKSEILTRTVEGMSSRSAGLTEDAHRAEAAWRARAAEYDTLRAWACGESRYPPQHVGSTGGEVAMRDDEVAQRLSVLLGRRVEVQR